MRQNIDAINRLKISWKESASNYENVFLGMKMLKDIVSVFIIGVLCIYWGFYT